MNNLLRLPALLTTDAQVARVLAAVQAAVSAGAGLLVLRGTELDAEERGDQLKSSVDRAAEGWVLGFLKAQFPRDRFLAEEAYSADSRFDAGNSSFWTVDALDGTRSYVGGFAGFCVQVAWIERGRPLLGVVHEPVRGNTYVALRGHGAYIMGADREPRLLTRRDGTVRPAPPARLRFIDSVKPAGRVGAWFDRSGAEFVECGSIGLKICRIADGSADIFAKEFRYRLWDVAPGQVLIAETGGWLGRLDGQPIDYSGRTVVFDGLLTVPDGLYDSALSSLRAGAP